MILNGILWILRTGAPWRDVPDAFGPWQTVWRLFDYWNEKGILLKVMKELQSHLAIDETLWCIDGTLIRASKSAAGGAKKR